MKNFRTKVIIILVLLVVGQFAWGKIQDGRDHEQFVQELETVISERDSVQVHADGLFSQWAAEREELDLENERLAELAKDLDLEVTEKNRIILRQKRIIEDLQAEAEVIIDTATGLRQDKVSFSLHKDGVKVTGYTLNPPPTAHLEIEHDPIKLDIHIARTPSGTFSKGLLDGPPWLNVEEWDLVVDYQDEVNPSLWKRFKKSLEIEVGGFVGNGGNGIPVKAGAFDWSAGVVATEEGMSYMLTRSFHPFGGDR